MPKMPAARSCRRALGFSWRLNHENLPLSLDCLSPKGYRPRIGMPIYKNRCESETLKCAERLSGSEHFLVFAAASDTVCLLF
jgi:hypothetical protein